MIQLQFINHLVQSGDKSLLMVNSIDDSFFSEYTQEFKFIRNHITQYGQLPDRLTFLNKFPDFDFIEVTENPNYLVDELYNDRNKRLMAKIFNRVRDCINADDVKTAMEVFNSASQDLLSASHIDCVDILQDKSRYEAYVERTQDFSKFYVKTGFDELDAVIGGWDRLEELATIVARPGVGKSWILLKCAIAAAQQGLTVGLYSGEMSERKVGYRFDTLVGHVSNRGIIQGNIDVMTQYKMFLDNLNKQFTGTIKVITPRMIKHAATVTDLDAFIEKEHLDMLCIDQHSLMEDQRRAKDPVTRAANISTDLKQLQVLRQIPIIAVSQQNRAATDDTQVIDVSRIAQSDKIGQDSTVVIFLEQKDGILTLHLAKARDGGSGQKLKYAIDLDKGVFQYMNDENDQQAASTLCQEFEGYTPF